MVRSRCGLFLLFACATACARDTGALGGTATMPIEVQQARESWPPGLAALIDSASAAYEAEQFMRASALYRRATEIEPALATGWWGVYIAEHARGRLDAADSAFVRASKLTQARRRSLPDPRPH